MAPCAEMICESPIWGEPSGAGSSPATFVSQRGILSRKQEPRESAKQAMMRKLFDIASEKGDEVKEPRNRDRKEIANILIFLLIHFLMVRPFKRDR